MVIIIIGVAGSGKTTIGRMLADALGWPFYDGDDFHPDANIKKMTQGEPLTDQDRAPWLAALSRIIAELERTRVSAIVACSALKKSYRETLLKDTACVRFVYLKASPDLIRTRLSVRLEHFMKADMIVSQFRILEEPDEAIVIDADQAPDGIVGQIRQLLKV